MKTRIIKLLVGNDIKFTTQTLVDGVWVTSTEEYGTSESVQSEYATPEPTRVKRVKKLDK